MKKSSAARRSRQKTDATADQLDRVVTQIIQKLKSGRTARLPGLGTLEPGKPWKFRPETESRDNR